MLVMETLANGGYTVRRDQSAVIIRVNSEQKRGLNVATGKFFSWIPYTHMTTLG